MCYKQTGQQALDWVQVKAGDIRAFTASKAFYGGVSVGQILQACHWKVHKTFKFFYLKDLTWSDNDNSMYLGPLVAAQQVLDASFEISLPLGKKKRGLQPLQPSLPEPNNPETSCTKDTITGYLIRVSFSLFFLLSVYFILFSLVVTHIKHQ